MGAAGMWLPHSSALGSWGKGNTTGCDGEAGEHDISDESDESILKNFRCAARFGHGRAL